MDLGHTVIQSGILPLTLAFVLTALLRVLGGSGWGSRTASGAVGIALLASTVLVIGPPGWRV
jgi:H+/gluconate symporter-like permease